MRAFLQNFWTCFLLGAPLISGSCSHSDQPLPEGTTVEAGIYITVNSGMELTSRATPTDGPYDPGAGYENYIHISGGEEENDFRVYFFTTDNVLISTLEGAELVPVESSQSSKRYLLTCLVDPAKLSQNFKVVMAANWRNYPELTPDVSTISDLVSSAEAIIDYKLTVP